MLLLNHVLEKAIWQAIMHNEDGTVFNRNHIPYLAQTDDVAIMARTLHKLHMDLEINLRITEVSKVV